MPIHVRANQGDYAEACLLPGDPLRATYIAETFMEDVVQRNAERGMLARGRSKEARLRAVDRDRCPRPRS
jgi:purine-nucleoside phosphorylase